MRSRLAYFLEEVNITFIKIKTARDIPQIVIKEALMKNCWHFLKNFMSSLKSSFNTFWNFSEHITHWKDFQILIYKTLNFFLA